MLKDFGYMRTFPHNLAQINIKSKPCHPVQIYQTRTVVFFFFFKKRAWIRNLVKKSTQQDLNIPAEKESNKHPLCESFTFLNISAIVLLKLDTLMTQQRRIHFFNMSES